MSPFKYPVPPKSGPLIDMPEVYDYPEGWSEMPYDNGNIYHRPLQNIEEENNWGDKWPGLPAVDNPSILTFSNVFSVNKNEKPCKYEDVLGYYMSWHVIGAMFETDNMRIARNGNELYYYNSQLNQPIRYGIHVCVKAIFNYIMSFSTQRIKPNEIDEYRKYCFYLTLIYVVAHEWGHYRSDVLSFQLNKCIDSLTGLNNSPLRCHYMSYLYFRSTYSSTNFEEVFAEWAALKYSIFNYHMPEPSFVKNSNNWDLKKASLRRYITEAIISVDRPLPYRDIQRWVDMNSLVSDRIIERVKSNEKSKNRSVNDNLIIRDIKSLVEVKMIDLLVHNQMQFSQTRISRAPIKSNSTQFPNNPHSIFYHVGDDFCTTSSTKAHQNSSNYLRLEKINLPSNNAERFYNSLINDLLVDNNRDNYINLPIKIFNDILPLPPVYIH